MVECLRLEIECIRKGTVGSNPTLSALFISYWQPNSCFRDKLGVQSAQTV
ncbi:MAG: hypothetical protein UU29_C0009G0071 [Candidatus Daviesbacteria bacterium GW2011_GWA2_40_9]|uniref:Uncharacterized protein n=1 Tax=Candidatus Daviesbacteria bacterium GW2011_GWA2_40_9 TaxID=1618424 RepID=A0A0G0WEW0_9BACT|nr:MAG: hypothetical protein UU29_C0009G0071 [Candidatus Daviesbacteria bacterium GW2011_GWA2_40_9]